MSEPCSIRLQELGLDGVEGATTRRVWGERTVLEDELALNGENFGEGFGGAERR